MKYIYIYNRLLEFWRRRRRGKELKEIIYKRKQLVVV